MSHVTPEEVARLLRSVGITKADMWDPKLPNRRKDGTEGVGNTNDLVKYVYMNPESNAILIQQLGREDMRLEWIMILRDDDPITDYEKFNLDVLIELERREQEEEDAGPYTIEGAGHMTAGQWMDALYKQAHLQQMEPREYLVAIRRGQYNIQLANRNIAPDTTFKQFCEGDYWLVEVDEDEGLELSPTARAEVEQYFSGASLDAALGR